MSTFETNIKKLEKALENIKSVKGRIYEGTTVKKAMDVEKKLNEAIRALESAKNDYNTLMKREEACKKNTMSEEEFNKVFTILKTSDILHKDFPLNESEIDFLKKAANKTMYKTYCNLIRNKFDLDPISKISIVGDITEYLTEHDAKERKIKIKDDDGKAIAVHEPELSIISVNGLEIKDKEGHTLYKKDYPKDDINKPIVLKISDDDLKNLVYNKEATVLYNHDTEGIELMWNLSVQENKYAYGFRLINIKKGYSFFASVCEYNPDNGIDFKTFKRKFLDGMNKTIDDIVHIKSHLDSIKDKEIEFLFENEEEETK